MQNICTIFGEGAIGLFKSKLTWYFVGCVLFSLFVAFIAGYVIEYFASSYVEELFEDEYFNRTWQVEYLGDLQKYVDDKGITAATADNLKNWTDKNAYVYISVYQNGKIIFNSDYAYADLEVEDTEAEIQDSEYLYRLVLSDESVARVDIFAYDYWKYYNYVWGLSVFIGAILFIVVMARMIQTKIRYITRMEKELQILEGGNLEYPITVKGNDELANLAKGIEQMRISVIENIKKEQYSLRRNRELVTAISHDLRTPLTTLTGYLEILNMDRVPDEGRRKHYLELSLGKTREIKALSDDLFEYFLIYGDAEKRIETEMVPVDVLAGDLIENQLLVLEEEGFSIFGENQITEDDGCCTINVKYMHRVLNNLISNIRKYAEQTKPVSVKTMIEQGFLWISVHNYIRKNLEPHESTKIGLITCERMMKLQQGDFQKFETEDEFTVKLAIPMEYRKEKEK